MNRKTLLYVAGVAGVAGAASLLVFIKSRFDFQPVGTKGKKLSLGVSQTENESLIERVQKNRVKQPLETSYKSRDTGVRRTRGLRILVLDGGRCYGAVSAIVLKKLEDLLSENYGNKRVFLADHFDMIAGTSIGGVISLAHGQSRLQLSDIVNLLENSAEMITPNWVTNFGPKAAGLSWLYFGTSMYRVEDYENMLKKISCEEDIYPNLDGGRQGSLLRKWERDDLNPRPDAKRPRVFAVSSPAGSLKSTGYRGFLFTNYPRIEYLRESAMSCDLTPICSSVPVWEAARATSAGPFVFPEARINVADQVHCFWDGFLVSNCPILEAISQAEMLFGSDRGIELIVSVGAGQIGEGVSRGLAEDSLESNFSNRTVFTDVLDSVLNTVKPIEFTRQTLLSNPRTKNMAQDRIFRLQPDLSEDQSMRSIRYFDNRNQSHLKTASRAARSWCGKHSVHIQFEEIANVLADRKPLSSYEIGGEENKRVKALLCAKTFFPPLLKLSKKEKKEHRNRDIVSIDPDDEAKQGSEEAVKKHAEKWKQKFEEAIVPILEFMEDGDVPADTWIGLKSIDDGLANDIETCRFTLWRCYIDRIMKYVGILKSFSLKRSFLREIGVENLLRVEKTLLPLDKANSLGLMRIDRKVSDCPKGIAWITKQDLKNLKGDMFLRIGTNELRHSIDDAHVQLRDIFKETTKPEEKRLVDTLDDLLSPELPQWMETHQSNPAFKILYQKWKAKYPVKDLVPTDVRQVERTSSWIYSDNKGLSSALMSSGWGKSYDSLKNVLDDTAVEKVECLNLFGKRRLFVTSCQALLDAAMKPYADQFSDALKHAGALKNHAGIWASFSDDSTAEKESFEKQLSQQLTIMNRFWEEEFRDTKMSPMELVKECCKRIHRLAHEILNDEDAAILPIRERGGMFLSHRGPTQKQFAVQVKKNLKESIKYENSEEVPIFLDVEDIILGGNNLENICYAVCSAERTITLLDSNYFASEWCVLELFLASVGQTDQLVPVYVQDNNVAGDLSKSSNKKNGVPLPFPSSVSYGYLSPEGGFERLKRDLQNKFHKRTARG